MTINWDQARKLELDRLTHEISVLTHKVAVGEDAEAATAELNTLYVRRSKILGFRKPEAP